RDGAVLPILHLNGYKISGPTVLGRDADRDVEKLLESHGYEVHFVEGNDPMAVHATLAATLDTCFASIRAIQTEARAKGFVERPAPAGARRPRSERRAAYGREPARERRQAHRRPRSAGLPRLCSKRPQACRREARIDEAPRPADARHLQGKAEELPPLLPRRD